MEILTEELIKKYALLGDDEIRKESEYGDMILDRIVSGFFQNFSKDQLKGFMLGIHATCDCFPSLYTWGKVEIWAASMEYMRRP